MKKLFSFVVLACLLAVVFTGCVTKTTTYTKTTQKDGTIVETTVTESDGSLLTEKTLVAAGSIQGSKVETTGSTSTGTLLPNFFMGGGNSIVLISPSDDDRPVFCYSRSISILGSLTNSEATGVSYAYKGLKGETAKETKERVDTLKSIASDETPKETDPDGVKKEEVKE